MAKARVLFGFFKKKKASDSLKAVLDGGNADYANFVQEVVGGLDNATRAHILVAYQNLIPTIIAMKNVARQQETAFSIDDFILQCADQEVDAKDEINVRRYAWFMWAALIYRLGTMSSRDAGLEETHGNVWCDIARCAPFLKALLPDNVVWSTEEKVWFTYVIQEPEPAMVEWAINHGGPKTIWKTNAVKKLAEEYKLFYHYDSESTMGPLTYVPPRPAPEN